MHLPGCECILSPSNCLLYIDMFCTLCMYATQVVIMLRGLPGSGKSEVAKSLKVSVHVSTCIYV